MKKLRPLMLCIALFVSVTAVAFVDDKGSSKATKAQSRNAKRTHSPITENAKRTHSPITGMDATTKATKK
jgi:hypothetical protein